MYGPEEREDKDWKDWRDAAPSKSSAGDQFKYQDETPTAISADKIWPTLDDQESPEK